MGRFLKDRIQEFIVTYLMLMVLGFFISNYFGKYFGLKTTIGRAIYSLLNPSELTYLVRYSDATRMVFPNLMDYYMYSMTLLFSGFFISVFVALVLSYLYYISHSKIKWFFKGIMVVLESIPEVMLILLINLLVVVVYKQTGFKILNTVALSGKRVFLFPILLLSIAPMIQLFKMMMVGIEEEQQKPYIEFAKAKGIGPKQIFFSHLMPNIAFHIYNHANLILLFMLSGLFVVESMTNINGFLIFVMNPGIIASPILLVWLSMLYIPFFVMFSIIEGSILWRTGGFKG